MNVVILFGSPRKNGCTARLTETFRSALPKGCDVKTYDAYELSVQPCMGCGACEDRFCCVSHDMEEVISSLMECDLLVIASPVYHLSFPSPLKAVIDRLQPCFCAHRYGRSPFADKPRQTVVLLAAGSPSENGEIIKRQLRWVLPTLNASLAGMVMCANTDASGVTQKAISAAEHLARELFSGED